MKLAALAAVLLIISCGCEIRQSEKMKPFPSLMLWAWERPEDFSTLNPNSAGVAYLCQTLVIHGNTLEIRPRLHPLIVPKGAILLAVTRIEVDPAMPLEPDELMVERLAVAVLRDLRPGVGGVQIDFDAKLSQRRFYKEVLVQVRRKLDPAWPLSITALASWAFLDDWVKDLSVDEVVPMCFEMGSDSTAVRAALARHQDFRSQNARQAIGISLREGLPWIPPRRRVYVFNHKAWTRESIGRALRFQPQ